MIASRPRRRSGPTPAQRIFLGALLLGLFPYFWYNIYAEYRGMGNVPQTIDLATVAAPAPNRGLWVRIPQVTIDCDNHAVDRGGSPNTFYVAKAPASSRPLVIDAGPGHLACADIPRASLKGVLRPLTARRRAYLEGRGLKILSGSDALVLNWGETPKSSKVILALWPLVALVGIGLVWSGLHELRRRAPSPRSFTSAAKTQSSRSCST